MRLFAHHDLDGKIRSLTWFDAPEGISIMLTPGPGELVAEIERLNTCWTAFKSSRLTDVKWCQPKLTVRVKHLAGSKTLRHATVKGLA